jgi:hypothetical protein|nr:MAG TPA: hypothetical protein [Caudoviricetes sp.]
MLKFKLNVAERKTLAKRMEELTGIHPYYTKAPLYSYDIGSYTIDRNGNLLVEPENADAELLTTLLNEGLIRGGESIESTDDRPEDTELTADTDEEPVTEAEAEEMETEETEQMTEVGPEALDEQEAEDVDTAEGGPADAPELDNTAGEDTAEEDPETEVQEGEESQETEDQPEEVPLDLELAFPVSQHNGVTLRNLVNLLYSRGKLIGKATGGHFHVEEGLVEKLKDDSCTFAIMNFINAVSDYEAEHGAALEGLKITTEKVTFTGFPTAPDHEHLTAFAQLAVLMNQQAISQKRIQAKDVNDENEKYALRTWLLRLGMNGPDFKETRKILMENLSGHAAFRTDEEAQKFLAREKAKRDALKAAKLAAQNGDPATGETVAPDTTRPTQPDCGADTAQMLEAGA